MDQADNAAARDLERNRCVGILTASEAAMQEVACLLAREEVGVSRATVTTGDRLDALRRFQAEGDVEVIVLVEERADAGNLASLLDQVKRSDKPTVVCALGGDPRRVWQAGAIPARRLDEAARRAAAWIRGWDQALISSQLQEEDELLLARARRLLPEIGRGRGPSACILAPPALGREARLMVGEVAGEGVAAACLALPAGVLPPIREAAADGERAVVLLSLGPGTRLAPGRLRVLVRMVAEARGEGLLIFAHLFGADGSALGRGEAELEGAGAVVAASNAAAARLAGMVLGQMASLANT